MPKIHARHAVTERSREQANAEVLLWQSRLRLATAVMLVALGVMLRATDMLHRVPAFAATSLAAYLAVNLTLRVAVQRRGRARDWMVATTVMADVLALFGVTYLVAPPEYYDRALLVGFAILHLTEFYFGRTLAWSALAALMLGYAAMVLGAIAGGAALSWPQELASLAIFGMAAGSFILHYGSFKWRLAGLAALFENAQEGDFSGEYDDSADTRPDGITMVGRAYNRVRSQLANLVLTDALSGCQNRRGLEQQLSREVSRAVRSGQELALMAVDVDQFKLVNDTFGHLAGDAVIQELGELLRDVARVGDVVARTGGDEFTLLLPDTNAAGAFRLATRVREEVAARSFQGVAGKIPVTVSIGLVADRVMDENVMHDLHSRADEALYAAKAAGRNRVSIWTPNLRAIAVTRAGQELMMRTG
jgi:diguanylate cyclase (GGDEF)-like protein